jgi:3-oxoacyl-[acyl-carrier protein] reductase
LKYKIRTTLLKNKIILEDRTALVTGVSCKIGIGFAIAKELLHADANVFIQSWPKHEKDKEGIKYIITEFRQIGPQVNHMEINFVERKAP